MKTSRLPKFNNACQQLPVRLFLCSAIILLLQACASTPATISYYDLGAATKPADSGLSCTLPPIHLMDITAPIALDSNSMLYRLLYSNDQQTRAYANSQWSMTPAQLLTQRIKVQFANSGVTLIDYALNLDMIKNGVDKTRSKTGNVQLRLVLNDFSQYFVDPTHSYSQLQIRASAIQGNKLLAQTTLQLKADADSANASGEAKAMRAATDELFTNLSNWLCKQLPP